MVRSTFNQPLTARAACVNAHAIGRYRRKSPRRWLRTPIPAVLAVQGSLTLRQIVSKQRITKVATRLDRTDEFDGSLDESRVGWRRRNRRVTEGYA